MSGAKRTLLQIPKPIPGRAQDGKFTAVKGDRLLEAHRQEKARAEPEATRKPR